MASAITPDQAYKYIRDMTMSHYQNDFEIFGNSDSSCAPLYSPNYDVNMHGFVESQGGFPFNRANLDAFPQHQNFESYTDIYQYHPGKQSPNFYAAGSPERRAPPSNLSTASGPSATSSAMGSPYSGHGHAVPAMVQGLALGSNNPGIVGFDSFPAAQEYTFSSGMDTEFAFAELKPGFVDPSLILGYPAAPLTSNVIEPSYQGQAPVYPPPSPALSQRSSHSSRVPKTEGSPYYSSFPYPQQRRPSLTSRHSSSSFEGSYSSDAPEKGKCPQPDCGKIFKDLKAHMLTHQNERPEKCPIVTCDYHQKGFARKYDKNRHTLTHYKGTMVCGFCPGSGSAAEKSFNRADVFKRHLTSVHAVEQTPPNSRKKTSSASSTKRGLAGYAPDATGKCSTCSATFSNAQDFYEHLDDCVLRIVQQEDPSEAINARRLAEVENDCNVLDTLRANNLPTTTVNNQYAADEEDDDEEMDDVEDDESSSRTKGRKGAAKRSPNAKRQGLTHSKGGVTLHTKSGRKNRKNYPSSWGCPAPQMKMKKRVMCAFDGSKRLWKDDMMLSTEFEVRIPLADGKSYVTDLDVQTMRRSEAFHNATAEEKGPDFWHSEDAEPVDLEGLMAVKEEVF